MAIGVGTSYVSPPVRNMQIGIMLVHSATEIVWRRRTRGILAGTKLDAWRGNMYLTWYELGAKFDRMEWTYSTRA